MDLIPWIILFLPLLAAAGITLFTLRLRELSASLSIGAIVIAFILSLALFFQTDLSGGPVEFLLPWLSVGPLEINFGVRLDQLSLLMLLIVTGVGMLIQIFSYGYMHEDRSFARYFAGL